MKTSARICNFLGRKRIALLAACASALIPLGVLSAQSVADRGARTASGRIQEFTTAPRGEIDGATLGDGTTLHWPPHVGTRVAELFKKGDRVEATGQIETGPAGDTHFEVRSIVNARTDETFDIERAGPPERPRRGEPRRRPVRERGAQAEARGTIDRFTTAPRGEIDGAVLDDGSVIHWPPHLQDRFRDALSKGDRVRVTGWNETTPRGDRHLEVATLQNVDSGKSVENDDLPPPRREQRFSPEQDTDVSTRLDAMQRQIDRLERELDRLRRER